MIVSDSLQLWCVITILRNHDEIKYYKAIMTIIYENSDEFYEYLKMIDVANQKKKPIFDW